MKISERVHEALNPQAMCRDCADHDGRCPNSGELCNSVDRAKELASEVSKLETQRDELAAYIQRVKSAYVAANTWEDVGDILTEHPETSLRRLKEEWNVPTEEHGTNRYGLDVSYFRRLFNRELNRTLRDYRPDELARILLRAAVTADKSVLDEMEFALHMKKEWMGQGAIRYMGYLDEGLAELGPDVDTFELVLYASNKYKGNQCEEPS